MAPFVLFGSGPGEYTNLTRSHLTVENALAHPSQGSQSFGLEFFCSFLQECR